MELSEYDNIACVEDGHWWYRGLAAISLGLLATRVASAADSAQSNFRILDAGCGPGGMLARLAHYGRPLGLDLHPLALGHAQGRYAGKFPLIRASIAHLPFASNHFNLVTSFDVLYHRAVQDDRVALQEFWRIVKPGGWLLLRVPALESLRGAHDVIVHTRHRYTLAELAQKLKAAGFEIDRLTYANTLLLPLIYLHRKLKSSQSIQTTDVELPSPFVNRLLYLILRLESLWLARFDFPIGVSLFALAHRPV